MDVKKDFPPVRIFSNHRQTEEWTRITIGGNSVRDLVDGMKICTSMVVMCHRDIQNQVTGRKTVVLSV
jgi:hypothetical protein